MCKYYAGIGSRSTPPNILKLMKDIGFFMASKGWILRSGRAAGADTWFEKGCNEWWHNNSKPGYPCPKEIFTKYDIGDDLHSQTALQMAKKIHPAWHRCNLTVQKLHARNMFQIHGRDLQVPIQSVICWTPEGKLVGGTRTAIIAATDIGRKVYNLGNEATVEYICNRFKFNQRRYDS